MKVRSMRHTTQGERTARTRIILLDAVKVAALMMMIQGHTLDALVLPTEMDLSVAPWSVWHYLRGFTAPIFLTVSGMLFSITMKRDPAGGMVLHQAWKRIRWSGVLMLISYILVFPASSIFDLAFVESSGWQIFFQFNILQLNAVALSLITVCAIITHSERNFRLVCLGLAFIITFLTPFVNNINWFSLVPEVLGAALSYTHGSYFPLFPYAAYMLFGAGVGVSLRRLPSEEHTVFLRASAWKLGMALLAGGFAVKYLVNDLWFIPQLDELQSMPSTVFFRTAVVMGVISGAAFADQLLNRYRRILELYGKQSLVIYLVHLVILFGTPWFSSFGRQYFKSLSLSAGMILAFVVVIATMSIVYLDSLLRQRAYHVHRWLQIGGATLLGLALLI